MRVLLKMLGDIEDVAYLLRRVVADGDEAAVFQ